MKLDVTVIKETRYIAFWVIIFSLLLQAGFLVSSYWNYTVVLGNILGGVTAVLNFLLMGITVQKAVIKKEEDAKKTMKVSSTYRNLMILIIAVIGISLPCFDTISTLVPLFFPRIAILIKPLVDKK